MKIRAKRHLHTLILTDRSKADKIKQSLPPCTFVPNTRSGYGEKYNLLTEV